jgi:Ca2+-binding EF-hand superfamily protein
MGCGYSQAFIQLTNTKQFREWDKTFRALRITRDELHEFYKQFEKVDLERCGSLDIVEFLTMIDVFKTPFNERVFHLFDEDRSGRINFFEFVISIWNYCSLTKVTLAMFAFDLFDRRSSGFLDREDVDEMFVSIYGRDVNKNPNVVK